MQIVRLLWLKYKSGSNFPSRLKFRDAYLTLYTQQWLFEADTDLLYTEVKYENVLDGITSAATPRPVERVPRDADFLFEVVYDVEDLQQLREDLKNLLFSLSILEDDYLGGNGSRGYGKIKFYFTNITAKKSDFYKGVKTETKEFGIVSDADVLSKNQRPDYETLMSVDDIRDKLQEIVSYFSS